MRFSAAAVAAFSVAGTALLCSEVSAFSPSRAFVSHATAVQGTQTVHKSTCACPACTGVHTPGCACVVCAQSSTRLYLTEAAAPEAAADIPAEVEAMDGIASPAEAHNAERPAREQIKKKRAPKGKALSEFSEGEMVKAKVKTITAYGAFMDFGAQTDALCHISRVAAGFVKDVNDVLTVGQEVDARIVSIDSAKNQVALSLLTEEEEQQAASGGGGGRPKREDRGPRQQQQQQRRDDSAVLNALQDKGWDPNTFVEGEVVNTADFGAFVRIDASKLNSEVEGQLDGLVHISSLSKGRAASVSAFAKAGDKVQVRCKGIQKGKVSLSMIAPEDEQQPRGGGGGNKGPTEGAKDWKEQLEKLQSEMPEFKNGPSVIDMRK